MYLSIYYFVRKKFRLLVTIFLIFVADTKLIFDYNFVASLIFCAEIQGWNKDAQASFTSVWTRSLHIPKDYRMGCQRATYIWVK